MNPFLSELPREPGFYLFRCMVTPNPELVLITKDTEYKGDFAVYSDGCWNDLYIFHNSLADSEWRKLTTQELSFLSEKL